MDNVNADYSCGNCGWFGNLEDCIDCGCFGNLEDFIDDCCPKCGSDQVGMITEEDFMFGNALFGKLWWGFEILIE